MEKKLLLAATTVTSLVCAGAVNAAIVFSDNFESPNVTTYTTANTSGQVDTAKWVESATGFASSRSGIVDESENGGLSFTDPAGSQAWAGRYTSNTGVSSKEGVIGVLTAGTKITVTFDAVTDGFNNGDNINAFLVLYNAAAAGRNDFTGSIQGTAAVLKQIVLTNATTSSYQQFSMTYTVGDAVVDNNGATTGVSTTWLAALLGKDIALRFYHRQEAIIDNVSVDIAAVPEPASLGLLGLGGLLIGRRRRS